MSTSYCPCTLCESLFGFFSPALPEPTPCTYRTKPPDTSHASNHHLGAHFTAQLIDDKPFSVNTTFTLSQIGWALEQACWDERRRRRIRENEMEDTDWSVEMIIARDKGRVKSSWDPIKCASYWKGFFKACAKEAAKVARRDSASGWHSIHGEDEEDKIEESMIMKEVRLSKAYWGGYYSTCAKYAAEIAREKGLGGGGKVAQKLG